ncbi:MAG: L,D-transpeptidase family protein, partial [Ignavibacteriaceae bacterium]|nr:L,D-transpeptidase family protein [Ignavibacteriaceae bacterium]
LANTELLVCDAVLRYSNDIKYGVLNPKVIFGERYNLPIPDSSKKDILEPLNQSNLFQYLNDVQPKSKKYKQLQAAFKHFKTFKNIEWNNIPIPARKIILGDRDSTLRHVNERLITLGFIDTTKVKINDYAVYDSLLENEIKEFQKAYGLVVDGVISKNTIEKLNITPDEYLNKIKVSLERFRWIDYSDTAKYILVNIPDFKLYAIENGNEKYNIKICTGRKRYASYEKQYLYYKRSKRWQHKPEDWETPSMYGQISYLVLNPTWTVPPSIMREEISAKIRKDSTYLLTANFKVYRDGTEIDPSEVTLQDFSKANIPYNIVQGPGAGNALGKIKFMFVNPFGIYLHDTPTRAPFGYQNRAVSHGCMRVEKPLQLAEYILQNNSKWNIDYLKLEIGTKINN